ncbi:MAG: PDZ domain-containing protein, partial [Candidatus Cloacimonetes bacterium]|nr:PDZ domain-containing protein [Candidatus Cloacimonadota bacterium]
AMSEIQDIEPIIIRMEKLSPDTPKMGVYLSDMDFEDAYKMRYPYCYGVLVSGVVTGGPSQKAGIIKGDIIMEFDGRKAKFEDHLVKLITSKNIGDEVEVKIFRDEEILLTRITLSTLKKAKDEEIIITKDGKKKKRLSVGFGGGSWIPVWYVAKDEFEDINYILEEYGFRGLNEEGLFLNGGGGKGNVGKGWFLGGMGAGYSIDRKRAHITDSLNVTRRMYYSTSYGGVTLDKRFALSKKLLTSLGFMLGWGGHTLQVSQTDGSYDWGNLSGDMDASANNSIELKRSYIMFQPKGMLMVRILDWLAFRAEVGYILSHSFTSGWKSLSCNDTFEVDKSPDTSYDGLTVSIGPWFGF